MKKAVSLFLILIICFCLFGMPVNAAAPEVTYTLNLSVDALPEVWNPHVCRTATEESILEYLTVPFVGFSIKDSENMEYQWTYKAATAVEDVTASHTADLTKYAVDLGGKDPSAVREGYVFRITLRDGIKWQNGEEITAGDYVESFKRLLDPDMQNYRASSYCTGETAVAGANGYFHSGRTAYAEDTGVQFADLVKGDDGVYATADGDKVYIAVSTPLEAYLGGASIVDYAEYLDPDAIAELQAASDESGMAPLTDDTYTALIKAISAEGWGEDDSYAYNYFLVEQDYPAVTWDTVGLYRLDDRNLICVSETYCDIHHFMMGFTGSWLVYFPYYDENKDAAGDPVTTAYGTDVSNSMSYGPYVLESCDGGQMVFIKNSNYYAFSRDGATGRYTGMSDWETDGKKLEVYQADRVVITELSQEESKIKYDNGELDIYNPTYSELIGADQSENLYKADETYVFRLFFNSDLSALQEMDRTDGNENSAVLSNDKFRKAFSLAVNRNEWISATPGWEPAYTLLNDVYYYDFYDDPSSVFRRSEPAMKAVCGLYGVTYGAGQTYRTLREAYTSIDGYDIGRARTLMSQACSELVADGIYSEGEAVRIRLAWTIGSPDESDLEQVRMLQDALNSAAEGSGFGRIELEAVGNIENRYTAVPDGEFAIGYGAWGGGNFYPFYALRPYCDPDYAGIQESACWDPSKDTLTININGKDRTETYQWWSRCMSSKEEYADADMSTKVQITAELERGILDRYYCIPLASSAYCTLTSDKISYYTHNYSVAYDFGGTELIRFNYTDEEWKDHSSQEPVLTAPTVTTAQNYGSGILVKWDEVEGAAGYVIYRRAMKSGETVWSTFARWNNTSELSFLDTKVYEGTKYQYGIKAYYGDDPATKDKLGPVGPMSTAVIYSKKPAAPTKTTTQNTDSGIKVSWDAVKGASGYVIYRRAWSSTTNGWTDFQRWNNTTSTSWTDTKVYAGTKYQYGIKAYYGSDPKNMTYVGSVGPLSTNVRITRRKITSLTASGSKVTAKWDASSVFTGYQVQYADNASFSNAVTKTVSDPKTSAQTVSVSGGKTYYFRVRSYHEYNGITYYGAWSEIGSTAVK